jgi:hypothetical protein
MPSVQGLATDEVLLITGSGPEEMTAGFFVVDKDANGVWTVEQLDSISSCGIVIHDGLLYRVLCSAPGFASSGELLVYDVTGVVAYRRIDGLVDPHGLVWTGAHLAVPCPAENRIALLDRLGTVAEWILLPGTGDAWHVNGVAVRDGRLYASAFGRFETERGWDAGNSAGEGLIFGVQDRETIIGDLHCPHDPTFLDGAWIVCDSGRQRLVAVDARTHETRREARLGAWTRGFAVSLDTLYVGLSGQRYGTEVMLATVAVLDRETWQLLDRVTLPCREIQTIARVPRTFLGALRRGFRTNAMRTSVQDREDIFRQVGNIHPSQPMTPMMALEPAEARIRFDAIAPVQIAMGEQFSLDVAVVNEGPRTLFSAMPYPVYVGYRWLRVADDAEIEALDERRCALPEPIASGATLRFSILLHAPSIAGAYRLRMTLVQEWIRWFDADDDAMGVDLHLAISSSRQAVLKAHYAESREPARLV